MINSAGKEKRIILISACGVMVVILLAFIVLSANSDQRKLNGLLDLGEKYLTEQAYKDAIVTFDEAIAIEPKCAQAYMGKAQAQYALGLYEDAIETLKEGIKQVDDSDVLEDFLLRILVELSLVEAQVQIQEIEMEDYLERPLFLNYSSIVRRVDTEEPEIQLEVLGASENEHYIWESSNPDCATVSETGLVTCLSEEGNAQITVRNEDGTDHDSCQVWIVDTKVSEVEETERQRVLVDNDPDQFFVLPVPEDDEEEIVIGDGSLGKWVYFSGDITIPEQLQYEDKVWPVTGIDFNAFSYCYKLERIHIPDSVEIIGGNPFFFCTGLKKIDVDEKNEYLKTVDGVLYSRDGTILYTYPSCKEGSSYTIPREVEEICEGAFVGCKNLEEILVEEGNEHYKSVDGVLIGTEDNELVAYPSGRKASSYILPGYVKSLGRGALCFNILEEIDCSSLEYIYDYYFEGCNRLKRVGGGLETTGISMENDVVEIFNIDEMTNLNYLEFVLSENQDFSPFEKLQNLEVLRIDLDGQAADLQKLGELAHLRTLRLYKIDKAEDLSWILNLNELESLWIGIEDQMMDLQVLQGMKNLKRLRIDGANHVRDFSWLTGLENLTSLYIDLEGKEKDLQVLSQFNGLEDLEIQGADGMKDFSWIGELTSLKGLVLQTQNSNDLDEVCEEIGKLKGLVTIRIEGISSLKNLSWVENMNELNILYLQVREQFDVTDLSPMMGLPSLRKVTFIIPPEDMEKLSAEAIEQVQESTEQYMTIDVYDVNS